MPSNPLPVSLPAECRKAKNIFASFVDPVNGLDSLIPPSILRRAKGFCFMSIAKAGFVLSARAGSGLVIAKLADGNWSAPSAVGTAGGGVGFQMGVEVTEFLIILNSRKAVKSFMAKGSITVGGNMSIAAGPLGRNVEGTGTLSSKGAIAAMYSYSRSKGLFGGASIEGSIIVERSDANAKAYRSNVTAPQLLSGAVDPPPWAEDLIDTITRLTRPGSTIPGWIDETSGGAEYPVDGDSDSDEAEWGTGQGGRARSGRNTPPYSGGGGGSGGGGNGQTPDELRERGYAFGSSYAAGGSLDPENTKEKGRISSMLGSMSMAGRERSGSGSSRRSGRGGGGEEDPFATPGGSSTNLGYGGGGPALGNEPRFETHFSPLENDFDFHGTISSASTSRPVAASRSNSREPSSHALPTSATSSPSLTRTSSTSKGKLTKPRSGSAASAGLRERAAGMQWGVSSSSSAADSGPGRESFDSLDDDRPLSSYTPSPSKPKRPPFGSRFRSSSSVSTSSSQKTQSPVTAFDPSALYSSSSSSKPKSRLRSSTVPSSTTRSPFGDEAGNESTSSLSSFNDDDDKSASTSSRRPNLNRALSKPWDSEDESYFTSPARGKPSSTSTSTSTSSPLPPSTSITSGPHPTTPGGHSLLDLTQVEADFASVMDLAKHGGEAEVGSYSAAGVGAGGRSRSGTLTTGAGTGGRSRSGTLTATGREGGEARPVGIGKDGIGWAVAKFDFPGVESTDLPFLKNDTLVILAKGDEEWWKARKGMREGIVPRNYLDAHFD